MKRLFKDNDSTWTAEANDLVREVADALNPIVDAWASKGYSIREISYIIVAEATHIAAAKGLSITMARHRKKKKAPKGFKV